MITKKLLNICPILLMLVAFFTAGFVVSCSHAQQHAQIISDAEMIADEYPDSALALLVGIDPAELTQDSIKAKYYYVLASTHDRQSHVALSDSMIGFSNDYYRGKDLKRSIRSATLLATYKFRIGERETAFRMLDSLLSLTNVPESLLIEPLRYRVDMGAYYDSNESRINRLMTIDKDENWHTQYKYWLYFDLLFSGKNDSALNIMDEFIDLAAREGEPEKQFRYEYEKMGVLEELGRYAESMNLADSLMNEPLGDVTKHYFHLWKSLAMFNKSNYAAATEELAKADSFAITVPADERGYFNSFAYVLHTLLDYERTGKVSLIPMARINNMQKDNMFAALDIRQEAVRHALELENQRLLLKTKNDRQTALLIIIVLTTMLVSGALIWYALNKKRKALEVLERNEILQKLVDESKSTQADASVNEMLRRAMLQQLGIIKMVAKTPTEQNREMLRKLSSIDSDTDGALVNWANVFEIIDNLYSGFYTHLHDSYGDILSDKEEQIIVLMMAGFSTKEISVITSQTMATIYTRKSTIRRKLSVPEKEDIVAFIRQGQTH